MSRSPKHRGKGGGPAFTQLYHWVRKTDAWRSLGPYARLLYIEIRARYSSTNNGNISYSYRQAQHDLGCSNKPIPGAFRELQERGFIKPVQKGAFSWKARFDGAGRATTWALTELPLDYPERSLAPTYEFKVWQPDLIAEKKTRHANSGPDARSKRATYESMARQKRTYDTPKAAQFGADEAPHGTLRAGTSISTISPQPLGQVSQALLRSELVKKATREKSRRTDE